MAERIPDRNEIRAAILYLARLYLSYDGTPFSGPLRVIVTQPEEKESRSFKPKDTLDGMSPPGWLAMNQPGDFGASASDLLRVLLSPDEDKLLVDLLLHQPCSASSVQARCTATMSKTDFWGAWGSYRSANSSYRATTLAIGSGRPGSRIGSRLGRRNEAATHGQRTSIAL